jgi:hypothetical protein
LVDLLIEDGRIGTIVPAGTAALAKRVSALEHRNAIEKVYSRGRRESIAPDTYPGWIEGADGNDHFRS